MDDRLNPLHHQDGGALIVLRTRRHTGGDQQTQHRRPHQQSTQIFSDQIATSSTSRETLKGGLPPLPAVPAPDRRADEVREERMWARRPGLQLPVKLSPEVPGMPRQLDDLHEVPPAADPGDPEPPRLQPLKCF